MSNTIEIQLPFCGFYSSEADQRIDWEVESYFDKEGDGMGEQPENFFTDFNDWEVIRDNYSKTYVECFEEWLADYNIELTLEYSAMTSPKYYNFETDRLFVNVPQEQLIKIYHNLDKSILKDMILSRHTSYDGFVSFYSNDIATWQDKPLTDWDANEWHTVLLAAIKQANTEVIDSEILDCSYGYETISNFIYSTLSDWEATQD
jgi:hypothetical protein